MYKLGANQALEDLGFYDIDGPGTGAIMGGATGAGMATTANFVANLLGKNLPQSLGMSLPELVALSGALGAGAGAMYGSEKEQ